MSTTQYRPVQIDLGPEYQTGVDTCLESDAWFSKDCQFALVLLKMTSGYEFPHESHHLVNLKTAATRKLSQPEWPGTFAFCTSRHHGLLRAHVAGADLRIDLLRIRADLNLDFVKTAATFRDFNPESHKLKVFSLEWAFLVDFQNPNERRYRGFDSVHRRLLAVGRRGNWHSIPGRNYRFLSKAQPKEIGHCCGSAFFRGCSQISGPHFSSFSFEAEPANYEYYILMQLSCQRQKLKPIKLEKPFFTSFSVSERFHSVKVKDGIFQLINSRSRKRARSAQMQVYGLDSNDFYFFDQQFIGNQLYLIGRDQIRKFAVCSGTPALHYSITANSNYFGRKPFWTQLYFKRLLVFQRKRPIGRALQQSLALVSKSPELQWPKKSGFEIDLAMQGDSTIAVTSVSIHEDSRSLYVFFSLTSTYFFTVNSIGVDLAVSRNGLRAESSISIEPDRGHGFSSRSNQFVLLALDLETGAFKYQLVSSSLGLRLLSAAKNGFLFAFSHFQNNRSGAQELANLALSTDRLKKFGQPCEGDSYSGILHVPNQLRPLSTRPGQVPQRSQPVDCELRLFAKPSSNLRQSARRVFQQPNLHRVF